MEHIHPYLGMYLINYNIQSVFYFGFFGLCSMISSPFFALADQGTSADMERILKVVQYLVGGLKNSYVFNNICLIKRIVHFILRTF